jgi:1-acyl-sn-glycerol-3-phosphate acyltransferase
MKTLDYVWRLFGTAFSFAVFGIAGLIAGLFLFPLLFIILRNSRKRKIVARRFIGKAFGGFTWLMKTVGVMDYRIEGAEHIACRPNQLIIANHPTLIDVVILVSLFPQANCVIKLAVTRNIFMRSTVSAAKYISNDKPEEFLESCTRCLKSGSSLILFPEGTRTDQGVPMTFEPGAATVAIRSGADILQIAIQCRPIVLTRHLPWYFVPSIKPQFTIRILPPVAIVDLVTIGDTERHVRQELNDKLLNIVNRELDDMKRSGDVNGVVRDA